MGKILFGTIVWVLAGTGLVLAQDDAAGESSPAAPAAPSILKKRAALPPLWEEPVVQGMLHKVVDLDPGDAAAGRFWIGSEYLSWWIKDAALATPLISTGPTAFRGVLGTLGTSVIRSDLDFGSASGLRLNGGGWLDDGHTIGLEGSGFVLEQVAAGFLARSDDTGNPLIAQPFNDTTTGPNTRLVSMPGTAFGATSVEATSRLWGAELNLRGNLHRGNGLRADVLGGFRYLDLNETLQSDGFTLLTSGNFFSGMTLTTRDYWATRNQFYGAQVGARFEYQTGRLFLIGLGKLALGSTHESATINGTSIVVPAGAAAVVFPGGTYNAASNIGRFKEDKFSVVPDLELSVGYQLTSHARASVGYDFLYWTDTARPANLVDNNVDTVNTPPTRPHVQPGKADFFAHGLHCNLEFRY